MCAGACAWCNSCAEDGITAASSGAPEQVDDLFVFQLREALEELADCIEVLRGVEADEAVHRAAQPCACGRRRDGNSDDELGGLHLAEREDGGVDAGSGGDAIIDEEDGLAGELERWSVAAIEDGTLVQELANLGGDALDLFRSDARCPDDALIQITGVRGVELSSRDGPEGKFFVAGDAKLVGEKDVQRQTQGLGDLRGDDDAATRDSEDDGGGAIGELGQVSGELASGVLTVLEDHGVTWALSLRGGSLREWFLDWYPLPLGEKSIKY